MNLRINIDFQDYVRPNQSWKIKYNLCSGMQRQVNRSADAPEASTTSPSNTNSKLGAVPEANRMCRRSLESGCKSAQLLERSTMHSDSYTTEYPDLKMIEYIARNIQPENRESANRGPVRQRHPDPRLDNTKQGWEKKGA